MAGRMADRLPLPAPAMNLTGWPSISRHARPHQRVDDRIAACVRQYRPRPQNAAHRVCATARKTRCAATTTPEDMRKALEGAIEDSDNLIRVFNALLTIARLESGHADAAKAEFDIAALLRDDCLKFTSRARRGQHHHGDQRAAQLLMTGNRDLIGQAIANLIDNAIKYAKPATPVAAP